MAQVDSLPLEEGIEAQPTRRYTGVTVAIALLIVVLIGAFIWIATQTGADMPGEDSAEVGFARDMIVHHSQAVEMALLLYDRTENTALKAIALDMLLSQQSQIGQMQGWLALWDVSFAGSDLPMEWMAMPVEGLMPGLATDDEMAALRAASGVEADRLFIQLMIPHHESGVHMAQGIVERTDIDAVRILAESIIASQRREIEELEHLAQELDEPVTMDETHH